MAVPLEQYDSSITSFENFPTERFKEQLENLSNDSVERATQYVIDNIKSIDDLFEVLLNRMRKVWYIKTNYNKSYNKNIIIIMR
ncbi:hypothetical protein DICPUDRAFT_39740 [Dictyostelium purpureum]|uniref:Uncharacterized protein n=1 Tax=Dictyostelium purpureum TaxID=5786 RepID=F0ZWU2_DICPU|nr:uncharacterized protein DICPUDRAFT_39740 [Dictyostelium purpureum]EGC31584.1 hypothetical protein DICPUDRAFT_39740 [Dictyostelium purpureum]|eukprot:XP_003291895.1 hypothetical protein DICPUDRAFT_39740 [Dictyostelium purpureum]